MKGPGRRVAVVTEHWNKTMSEPVTLTRLLAGALARTSTVSIVHLDATSTSPSRHRDSIFQVHEVPIRAARPLRAELLRAALASGSGSSQIPEDLEPVLERYTGHSEGLGEVLESLQPDAVVLVGHHQTGDLSALGRRGSTPRVLFVPILDGLERAGEASVARLVELADQVATVHPGEQKALARAYPARRLDIVPLEPALPLNRSATEHLLFGVHWFGTYVLLIRAFPPTSPRYERSITRELLSSLLGVSVAEVDGDRFTVSDDQNTVDLPVNPTRVNLWRLMAHAKVTIDTRPPGPFGQEAIESMLLGTPVVVPAGSAAHATAAASGGGLAYDDVGELLDAARALLEKGESERVGEAGRRWAVRTHGDAARFVTHAAAITFGVASGGAEQGGDQPVEDVGL